MGKKSKRFVMFILSVVILIVGGYFLLQTNKEIIQDNYRVEGDVISVELDNDMVTILARMDSFFKNPFRETIELNILIKDDTSILIGNNKREYPMEMSSLEPGDSVIVITNEPLWRIQKGSEYSAKAIKKSVEEIFIQRLDATISSIDFNEDKRTIMTALVELNTIIPNHPEEIVEVKILLTEETLIFFGNSKEEYPMEMSGLEPGDPIIIITNEPLSEIRGGSKYSAKVVKKFVTYPEALLNF